MEVKKLANGSVTQRSPQLLGAYPTSQSDWIEQWAESTLDTVFVADRNGVDGTWRKITYTDLFDKVWSIGHALFNRGLSAERPVEIRLGIFN